jgi:hypothetical protein
MALFLNLLAVIQDNHNRLHPRYNIFGSTFDPGGPTEYDEGTRVSVPRGKKYEASRYE